MRSIMDILLSPWTTQVLFTAVRLRLFTILADKSMTAEEIASRLETTTRHLKPLLDACAGMDLIMYHDGRYRNSEFSRTHLFEGKPEYTGDFYQLVSLESGKWSRLYDMITGSDHDMSERHQGEIDPRLFTLAMNNIGMLGEARALGNAVDLGGCRRMVDAGGGSGLYSVVLCGKYHDLRSIVVDKSKTLEIARELITGSEEKNRIELLEGDISKDPLGENIDVVLLSDVAYEASFADKVLRNAKACLRENGLLVVRGYYSDPENPSRLFGTLFWLNQVVFNPKGSFLTLPSLKQMLVDTGFTIIRSDPLTELSFLILARKQTAD
jgi:predicted nicotinamide N-methyase